MIRFQVRDRTILGYLAVPASGRGPGVVVCHAWWGLTPFFKQVCDRLAAAGFVALAPDYYFGHTADSIKRAKLLRIKVDRKWTNLVVRSAVDQLLAEGAVSGDKLGAIGFSLGASFALEAARTRPTKVAAVVLFYGTGGGRFDKTLAAYQGHFAEDDRWGGQADKVQKLQDRLLAAQREVSFYTYPGTRHWFFEDDQEEDFDPAAADLAWRRTVDFLRVKL